MKVLVVDDDSVDRRTIQRHLKGADRPFEFVEASSVSAAREILNADRGIDIALLDLNLPDGQGIDLLGDLIGDDGIRIPAIMLTGQESVQSAVEAIKAGAADYIGKDSLTDGSLLLRMDNALRTTGFERETKAADAARRDSNARTRAIMAAAPLGIISTDDTGHIELINEAARDIFGYDLEDLIGKAVYQLYAEPFRSQMPERLERYYELGNDPSIDGVVELVGSRKDGSTFPTEVSFTEYQLGDRRHFVGVIQDITTRKDSEERLRQAQKMETVGQLTGGIAHDFNNILMAMQLNLELLHDRLASDPDAVELSETLLSSVNRGAELTGRLLAFARRQPLKPEIADINALVESFVPLFDRTFGADIEIVTALKPSVWPAEIDAGQLENAILNLAVNARDAMPEGGKLTIETGNTRLDEDYASSHNEVAVGDYVVMSVSDTGTGMPQKIVERAFDPFFTTKATGKGTGLGLSMVYGFVKQSGGHIKIYSEEGQGTTIKMYFPRSFNTVSESERSEREPSTAAGNERILLVEDDPDVRVTVERLLTSLGYAVTAAIDGPEALTIIDAGLAPELLLVDVVLPHGMSGRDVSREVTQPLPECKVLYMSGYAENAIVHHGRLDPGVMLLSKPFPRTELSAKIRQALDR